jgi:enoyl reductase-like protein
MTQETILNEGAFDKEIRDQINANFTELYGSSGTFTANGATPVTVANTAVTANSNIIFTLKTVGGTVGAMPRCVTITPGTGFNVNCTASDTSVYNYRIIS